MKTQRIYIDTSVIGGCFDTEFAQWSNGLMDDFRIGIFEPVVSEVVALEVRSAPKVVREKYAEILELEPQILEVEDAERELLYSYRKGNILPEKFINDMLHIALATVAEVDLLVSWNFRHIVRFDKIRSFNAVNIEIGYKQLDIYSPREVTTYGEH